jgi:hypothetical protein
MKQIPQIRELNLRYPCPSGLAPLKLCEGAVRRSINLRNLREIKKLVVKRFPFLERLFLILLIIDSLKLWNQFHVVKNK